MAEAMSGDVRIHYEDRGPADGIPLLMVMGLGAQMIAWRDGFCDMLGEHGLRVIRFDNRDVGLSSKTEDTPPDIAKLAPLYLPFERARRRAWQPPYLLKDMAADAVAVLDDLGIESAHVVGASMGGMIAQTTAIEFPRRVRSLTSIMSTTGGATVGRPTTRALKSILTAAPDDADVDAIITHGADRHEVIAGRTYEREAMIEFLKIAYDRDYHPTGSAFQVGAILASGDRTAALKKLDCPTLVLHGREDPLIRLSGGTATAKAIPDAQMVIYNEMGHSLPLSLWEDMTEAIGSHCNRVERRRAGIAHPAAVPGNIDTAMSTDSGYTDDSTLTTQGAS